jgi:hypothetical protein
MFRLMMQPLHIGETERGAGEDKDMVLVLMVLFRELHQSMFDYRVLCLLGYKGIKYPCKI